MYRSLGYGYYSNGEHRAAHYTSYYQPQPKFSPTSEDEDICAPLEKRARRPREPQKSMVGCNGYPEASIPAPEKSPFTAEDNAKLKALKERVDPVLSWKQIAAFFPGRSHNTLQVHYCTKIKGASVTWTPDLDRRLRRAVKEDEAAKGKRVARVFRGSVTAEECEARMKIIGTNTAPQKAREFMFPQPTGYDGRQNTVSLITDDRPRLVQSDDQTLSSFYGTKRRRLDPPARTYTRDDSSQSSAFWTIIRRQQSPQ